MEGAAMSVFVQNTLIHQITFVNLKGKTRTTIAPIKKTKTNKDRKLPLEKENNG